MDDLFKIKAGKVLREIREGNNKPQTEIAALLGKDQSQISRIERGKEDIRFAEVDKLCGHFGVSMVDVVAQIKFGE